MEKLSIIHKVDRIKISQSTLRKSQLHVHVLNIKVKKFQGTRNLLAVIGQLLIEVSHHVHCTCTWFNITLHKFCKKCPTHRVHQKDLKTNQKK